MTSPDGITWTSRTSAADNNWRGVTYGNGLFVAVAYTGTGNRVMTSPDGITWTSRTSAADNTWTGVTYANGLFVAVASSGTGNRVMTSSIVDFTSPSNNLIRLSFTTPSSTYLSRILVLQSTNQIGDIPKDGTTYATGTLLGSSVVACSFAVATSTPYSCDTSSYYTYNAVPYYFKIYAQDTNGNYSDAVVTKASTTPGRAIILGTGIDASSTTLLPGASATTSNSFVLKTDYQTDRIQSLTVTFASSTATTTSLVEITDSTGTFVYGSTSTPSDDIVVIPVTNLIATTASTTYKIRITPKSHTSMPAPSVGTTSLLTTYISDLVATYATNKLGSYTAATTVTIDNLSPKKIDQVGIDWKTRSSASNSGWSSVTYGNGLFVAVASTGNVMTSSNGITWTSRTAASSNSWRSVTYGNGLFVAVAYSGTGNRVMTSPDGITWTSRTSAADNGWYGVTYGNGLFVAVACGVDSTSCNYTAGNRVMTSPDGITWTIRTSAADGNQWYSVTYGNGLFVAVAWAGTSNRVMTSPDGITWTIRTMAADNVWSSVTYGNGLFVAVAYSGTGNRVMTSPDGTTWTSRTSAADNGWYGVTYGNGLFVAVAQSGTGNRVMTSPDGITWTIRTSAADNSWRGVTYGNGLFVAVASSGTGNRVMTSSSSYSVSATSTAVSITFTNPTDSDISTTTVLRSTSPVTDTPVEGVSYATSSTIGASTAVCSFAVTASSTTTCTATGLTNGTPYYFKIFTQDTSGNWSTGATLDPVSPGDKTVTLGTGNDDVGGTLPPGSTATTSDTFTLTTDTSTDVIQSVTVTLSASSSYALSLVEITNDAGSTVYGSQTNPTSDTVSITLSTNTLTATTATTTYRIRVTPKSHTNMPAVPGSTYGVTSYVSSVRGTSGLVIGNDFGATTTVLLIDNQSTGNANEVGFTWTSRTSAADNDWYGVTYGNGLFVAVAQSGTGNRVMTSPDGIAWTSRTSAADNDWYGVTYGNGLFVAVAATSTTSNVMTSSDGVTWTLQTGASVNNWRSVTYGNGLFVAVASSGSASGTDRIMTSSDGITWTSRTNPVSNLWYSVTYGNGLFVAVAQSGTGNRVMTSPDGIAWTSRTSAADNVWSSVTYGNGLFVAVAYSGTGNRVMTSPDGTTWTSRTSAADNGWYGVTYGNGLFVAVAQSGTGNRVMTSPDGITWTIRTSAADNSWRGVTYGNGLFVAVASSGTGNRVMTSPSSYAVLASSTSISITFTNPDDTDTATTTILRSTSPITDTPTEGVSYATSSTIGASNAVCSFAVTASSTTTCTATGLTNGTPYYFKIFTQDTSGNWSTGATLDPVSPGDKTITLGTGTDGVGGTLLPGGTATTSNTFTLTTDTGTDVIQSVTITLSASSSEALSLIEITNDAGSTVYGSQDNPTSDTIPITLSTNTLTATTATTTYRIRITPKSHVNMPLVPGSAYYVTSYISNVRGTSGAVVGNDFIATTVIIDNESPAAPSTTVGTKNSQEQIILSYTTASTLDSRDVVVLRSTSPITDSPVEGTNYAVGNTIGASTVTCVASSTPLSTASTCTFTSPLRATNYYFKIFTKDTTGNYSTGASFTGEPFIFPRPNSGRVISAEPEAQNGATTTVTGGGSGGGYGGVGTTTSATTTVSTSTPTKGGGGGDSGNLYTPSNLASFFNKTFDFFFSQIVAKGSATTYAEAVPTTPVSTCALKVFGICVISNLPGIR